MPRFKVAHVKEQGIDLIIIPVESDFGNKTSQEKQESANYLQIGANNAGLAGTVVPVWDEGRGRMGFFAPSKWHLFFESVSLAWVAQNINREIYR